MIFYEKEYPQTVPWLSVRSYVCLFSGGSMLCRRRIRPDPGISFYMENINDAQCVLTVQNGKASASASVTGRRGAERCKIVLEIQKKQGSQWITVDSWSVEKDGRNANLSKSVEAKKGTTYRAKVKVTVWLDGKSETKTITTSGKTA